MKDPKNDIIKLKITNCDVINKDGVWWSNKIDHDFYFWKKPFTDDSGVLSLWVADMPKNSQTFLGRYVYIKCTNYDIYIRKIKLDKIKNI